MKTRSSAVAKRPRDASSLSVVSFVASIVQYLKRRFFIISYFSFGFTSAYNSILFCCLRRNVKPCRHTHDLSCLCRAYSARARSVALALKNHGDSDLALRGRIPAVYDQRCKGPFIATQLNSTRRRVELSCVGEVSIATRRRNST